jgi:hypothetical protein
MFRLAGGCHATFSVEIGVKHISKIDKNDYSREKVAPFLTQLSAFFAHRPWGAENFRSPLGVVAD